MGIFWLLFVEFGPLWLIVGGIGTLNALISSHRRRSYFLAVIFGGVFGLFGGAFFGLLGALAATWFVFAFGPGIPRKICAGLGAIFGLVLQTGPGWTDYATAPAAHLADLVARCLIDGALAAAGAAFWLFIAYLRKSYHTEVGEN
jgi:hypothetical protein